MGFLDFFSGTKDKAEPKYRKGEKLFSLFSEDALRPVIFSIEEKEIPLFLPDVQKKRILEIAPHQKSLETVFESKGAKVVRVGGAREKEMGKAGTFILSHWESLPVLPGSQDAVLLRAAFLKAGLKTGSSRLLKEAARVSSSHGKIVLSEMHPFQAFSRVDSSEAGEAGFERYWKSFTEAGLKLTSVREIFWDNALRKLVFEGRKEEGKKVEVLKNTPLLILFCLEKISS